VPAKSTITTTIAAMLDHEDRLRRVGENEALYRLVNERIQALSAGVITRTGEFGVICECAALDCKTQIMISPKVYEQARANSDHFIVVRGHEINELETLVEDHGSFIVIAKTPQEAKQIAEEMDPRT
jgi:hypothetical protein